MTSILLEIKKGESRKSVKHAATNGGFRKTPKKNPRIWTFAMNVHITMRGWIIFPMIVNTVALVAMDVLDQKTITIITAKIRSE